MTQSDSGGNIKGALFALLAFGIFSTHDIFIKILGAEYAPIQILFFSGLFSFPLISFMLMGDATPGHLRPVHPWWVALRCAMAITSALSAFYAFTALPLAQVYAIIFAAPLIITVLAIPVLGETVGPRRWAAVIVGLIGVLIVLRPGQAGFSLGHAAALTAAIAGATNSVISRKIGREERSVVLLLYPMTATFLLMGSALPFVYRPMPMTDFATTALVSALAFLAMLALIRAYRLGEAVIVAPMQYSQLIWATAYGYLIFGETLDETTLAGAGVVIASGLYILFRESRGQTSTTTPVLRTRTRAGTGLSLRVSSVLRRNRKGTPPPGPES